jgi:hypothetical protein
MNKVVPIEKLQNYLVLLNNFERILGDIFSATFKGSSAELLQLA